MKIMVKNKPKACGECMFYGIKFSQALVVPVYNMCKLINGYVYAEDKDLDFCPLEECKGCKNEADCRK